MPSKTPLLSPGVTSDDLPTLLRKGAFLAALLTLLSAFDVAAAVRLTYLIAQQPTTIAWPQGAFPISYSIDPGAQLIAANEATVRKTFEVWQTETSSVRFRQGAPARAGGKDGINSVSVKDGMFAQSGFIAYTTTWFDERGDLQEADIQFDPNAINSENLAPVLQHEIGHMLGLDHSANLSATMYPFVGNRLHPLADDDAHEIAALYPENSVIASRGNIRGRITAGGAAVFGAQIVALDSSGAAVASALSSRDGRFDLRALPAGTYRVYAEPLDGPVEGRNLSGIYRDAMTDFLSTPVGTFKSVNVTSGAVATADLDVVTGKARLNPKWVGSFPAGSRDIQLSSMSATVKGGRIGIAVGGEGFAPGTTFEIEGSSARRVSDFEYGNGFVFATFDVQPAADQRTLTIVARSGNESAMLTGAIRVEPKSGRARPVR